MLAEFNSNARITVLNPIIISPARSDALIRKCFNSPAAQLIFSHDPRCILCNCNAQTFDCSVLRCFALFVFFSAVLSRLELWPAEAVV